MSSSTMFMEVTVSIMMLHSPLMMYLTIDNENFTNKVHEGMNSLVKYMIWRDCNITIDTENFMNKVHEGMNSLVKYMIRGECNITIDTENFMN